MNANKGRTRNRSVIGNLKKYKQYLFLGESEKDSKYRRLKREEGKGL